MFPNKNVLLLPSKPVANTSYAARWPQQPPPGVAAASELGGQGGASLSLVGAGQQCERAPRLSERPSRLHGRRPDGRSAAARWREPTCPARGPRAACGPV